MEKEIVLYRTFDSPVEANIVKDVLETNGVPCFLSNEIFSSVLPLTNSEVGAIRLNVFAEDVEKIFGKRPWTSRTEELLSMNEELPGDEMAQESDEPKDEQATLTPDEQPTETTAQASDHEAEKPQDTQAPKEK